MPAFTLAQYANLPARFTAFKNTLLLAPAGTLNQYQPSTGRSPGLKKV